MLELSGKELHGIKLPLDIYAVLHCLASLFLFSLDPQRNQINNSQMSAFSFLADIEYTSH